MDNKNIFAKNLNYYMDLNGKSRRDMCEALGFSYFTFSDWCKGKKYPRMDKVEMLADYFGILKSDLIEEKSVNARIEEDPVGMAELHFEMIEDVDFTDLFEDFKKLTKEEKQMVKKIVRSMANEDV